MSQGDDDDCYVTAGPDDCITSLSEAHGFFWKTVWDDSKNSDLKEKRKNPNVLMEGDSVYIPKRRLKEVDAATEQRHKFVLKGVPAIARFRFLKEGKPQANVNYVLNVDGDLTRGKTDGDGMVVVSIPPSARSASILLGDPPKARKYNIALGKMDPVGTDSGVRKRLEALGFNPGSADEDTDGGKLKQAIVQFQGSQKLKQTGDMDDAFRDKLLKAFGS